MVVDIDLYAEHNREYIVKNVDIDLCVYMVI